MTPWLEVLLLFVALGVVAALGWPLLRDRLRARRERRQLDRLDPDAGPRPSPLPVGDAERRLRAAGISWPVLAALGVVAALALAAGAAAFLATGLVLVAFAAVVMGAALLWSVLGSVARARARKFEDRLVDAVGLMIAILEAGENPRRALEGSADGSEEPVASELRAAVARLEAGADIDEALEPIRRGYDSEGVRLFTQTLIAKWDAGGDLAPILQRVHRVMLERMAMRLRLQSELAGARLSAIIVSLLPYVLIPYFAWQRPEWLETVFDHPLGLQLLVGAILLQIVGLLWMRRLFRLEAV